MTADRPMGCLTNWNVLQLGAAMLCVADLGCATLDSAGITDVLLREPFDLCTSMVFGLEAIAAYKRRSGVDISARGAEQNPAARQ